MTRAISLVGRDEHTLRTAESMLPSGFQVRWGRSLSEVARDLDLHDLTVYNPPRLDRDELGRVSRFLDRHPHRLAVLCDDVEPGATGSIVAGRSIDDLVGVESSDDRDRFRIRLLSWIWARDLFPKPRHTENVDPRIDQMWSAIDRRPYRNWQVSELAGELDMSVRHLNRLVNDAHGESLKSLLTEFRYRLLERVRRSDDISTEGIIEIFEFATERELDQWMERARRGKADFD